MAVPVDADFCSFEHMLAFASYPVHNGGLADPG